MRKISFCSSMALDALFFIKKSKMQNSEWMPLYICDESEIFKHPTFKTHFDELDFFKIKMNINADNIHFDMSSMALLLSAFTDNSLENITLDDLIKIFENTDHLIEITRPRIINDFSASHVYPLLDNLKQGLAYEICILLETLKKNGFEYLYNNNIIPYIKDDIEKYNKSIAKYDLDKLYNEIALMKNSDSIPYAKIYVNFFSFPLALNMYHGSFSVCYSGEASIDFFSIVAHEMMHGFADNELLEMYRKYMNSDSYLSENHSRLLSDFGSGDEEEFVKSAEYYLCLRSGHYKKSDLLDRAKAEYEGVCPFSVIIFDLLSKERETPKDYNKWLKNIFLQGKLPTFNIEGYVSSIE